MNPLKKGTDKVLDSLKEKPGKLVDSMADATGYRLFKERLPHPQRPGCITIPIPGYKQLQTHTCGYASAANVLHLFQPKADLDRLFADLYTPDRSGVNEYQECSALRRYGLGVRKRASLDLESISDILESGHPIICEVKTMLGNDHYLVLYGCDLRKQTVFLCGSGWFPVLNWKEISYDRFLKFWEPKGNGLICSPGTAVRPPGPRKPKKNRVC